MKKHSILIASLTVLGATSAHADEAKDEPITIAIEAEHFRQQRNDQQRRWFVTSEKHSPDIKPDRDPPHYDGENGKGASGRAYLEILPDTRVTHADPLQPGVNFSNTPGQVAVLDYEVKFPAAGRYYVWVRAFSAGTEDNGIHVGLDGRWPDSGARMQWCEGKRTWRWESKQRTAKNHCGEPHKIYLDVPKRGRHTVSFSMREDGFEFDKFILTTDREFKRPDGPGPEAERGRIPKQRRRNR